MLMGSLPRYTRWALSMVMTKRCSVISWTVFVFGTSTSMPDCRIGAVIMKMISNTRTTSMNGIMLISESVDWVGFEICIYFCCRVAGTAELSERLFDLRSDLQRKSIQ